MRIYARLITAMVLQIQHVPLTFNARVYAVLLIMITYKTTEEVALHPRFCRSRTLHARHSSPRPRGWPAREEEDRAAEEERRGPAPPRRSRLPRDRRGREGESRGRRRASSRPGERGEGRRGGGGGDSVPLLSMAAQIPPPWSPIQMDVPLFLFLVAKNWN